MLDDLKHQEIAVGLKQSTKLVLSDGVSCASVADDAQDKVKLPFIELCREHQVELKTVETMVQLGKACGIEVGAAVAVTLK